MKKNNFKKILVVFSLCVFLLSLFSISSFALNISDVDKGYLYNFKSSLTASESLSQRLLNVSGYLVDKSTGNMTSFSSLYYKTATSSEGHLYYSLLAQTGTSIDEQMAVIGSSYNVYIDYSSNTISKSSVESIFSQYWSYSVTSLDSVGSMFDKASIALNGGTNGDGVAYDGLLGMVAKFGKFLVSSPLLLVLCIALPLVSFSVGLIIRIKNRA